MCHFQAGKPPFHLFSHKIYPQRCSRLGSGSVLFRYVSSVIDPFASSKPASGEFFFSPALYVLKIAVFPLWVQGWQTAELTEAQSSHAPRPHPSAAVASTAWSFLWLINETQTGPRRSHPGHHGSSLPCCRHKETNVGKRNNGVGPGPDFKSCRYPKCKVLCPVRHPPAFTRSASVDRCGQCRANTTRHHGALQHNVGSPDQSL